QLSNSKTNEMILRVKKLWKEGKIKEGYNLFLEEDIELMFDVTKERLRLLKEVIRDNKIDIIFRDAVDKFGYHLSVEENIPSIGYITHNLYSKEFFEQNPNYYYAIFMDAKNRIVHLPRGYFENFRNKVEEIYQKNSTKKGNYSVFAHHEFDPMSNFTIIFSTDFLQPLQFSNQNRKYLTIYPDLDRFKVEKKVPKRLINFVSKQEKLIYIASGSLIPQSITYYKKFIDILHDKGYGIVISCKKFHEELKRYCNEKQCNETVFVGEFIPQQFILSKADLFISHGGQNSTLEAIFHRVPILVTPMTSEQRMNGLIIEKAGVGMTIYDFRKEHITMGKMFDYLLNNKKVEKKLETYSDNMKKNINDFSSMWEYLKCKTVISK
ncbi:glycosyltransferase, partial [Bacillus paranthracis]|uniref:glycosyltransferase n=1 Tax=Bacillus paranthracis TaxID=2026186 RepID=UPI002E1D6A15|nr:glycosyltransferase [Bacillus paranthracis]